MENPEILWRIEMERFVPVEIFLKKEYFSRPNLFPIFTETTEIFLHHLFGLLVPRFMSRESKKLTDIL